MPYYNLSVQPYTTYRIGGLLDLAFFPESTAVCIDVLNELTQQNMPITVLGWGSNTIVASQGIRGATLITRKLLEEKQLDDHRFELGAGVHLARIATLAQQQGLRDGEYMIGIPATLGGAVRMNAGAMGQETAQVVESVTLYDFTTQQVVVWGQDALGYQYRHSNINPDTHMILSAVLRFTPGDKADITQKMNENVTFRKTHHPIEPNGGSVFQNPDKAHTVGKMLDELGAKGWRQGDVMISPRHANFIINVGKGTSTDLLKLMIRMKTAIKQHFGFTIHPENKIVGELTAEETALWLELI